MDFRKKRILFFGLIFGVLNLSFIPLLSLYGLRVCPVLSIPGFGFGCYYSALYISLILLFNTAMILLFSFSKNSVLKQITEHLFFALFGIYCIATLMALLFLNQLLKQNHLSTHSRAPEILGFASLMLGVTQSYGMIWAFHGSKIWSQFSGDEGFRKNWIVHMARTLFPILVVSAVLLHFIIGQSVSFNEGSTAPVANHDDFITQVSYLIYFLLTWLAITFSFHFLSERDQLLAVQAHLESIGESLDTKFRSEISGAWGLWRAILANLNRFSQTLGERTRLLSAFSKFVSAGVAKEVLSADQLNKTGETKEMTVIMVDIRGFTAMSEQLSPTQVVQLLNEYFSSMLDAISTKPVVVDKFIGDGILAYVEPTGSKVEESRMAVDVALKMIANLSTLNQKLALKQLPEIKIGIGVYRGPLVVGLIGTEAKMQHTIIGDTVNRASRLEGLCKELAVPIVLSGWVWHTLEESQKTKFRSFGKRSIKGITESMEVFGGP